MKIQSQTGIVLLRKTQSGLKLREQRDDLIGLTKTNILRKRKYFITEIPLG